MTSLPHPRPVVSFFIPVILFSSYGFSRSLVRYLSVLPFPLRVRGSIIFVLRGLASRDAAPSGIYSTACCADIHGRAVLLYTYLYVYTSMTVMMPHYIRSCKMSTYNFVGFFIFLYCTLIFIFAWVVIFYGVCGSLEGLSVRRYIFFYYFTTFS